MSQRGVDFPDRSSLESEAAAWLIRLDSDAGLTAGARAELREWMARSPMHAAELASLAHLWDRMNVLTDLAVPLVATDCRGQRYARTPLRLITRYNALAAVAVILCLGIAASYQAWWRADPLLAGNGLYATTVGQQKSIELVDGSLLLLNTNSQIAVHFTASHRNVRLLQGEVNFKVASNKRQPFRVYAGDGRVQAVGTEFSVYLREDAVNVTVTEGSVSLAAIDRRTLSRSDRDRPLQQNVARGGVSTEAAGAVAVVGAGYIEAHGTLDAGQSAVIEHTTAARSVTSPIRRLERPDISTQLSWREGFLTFSGETLDSVVDEISRYTTVSIEIDDPAVRAIRIGGRFPVGETEAMLDVLQANFGLQVTQLGNNRILLSAVK